MTLTEYADGLIRDPEVGTDEWFPKGWIVVRGGPVHVEAASDDDKLVALCGHEPEDVLVTANARVLLRRAEGCKNCEKAVPDE